MKHFYATLEILSIWVIYITPTATSDRKLDPQTQSPCGFTFSYTKFLRFCFGDGDIRITITKLLSIT